MPGLLVSVRDAAEAADAVAAGADLIDVKDPAGGPLGAASAAVVAAVLAAVAGRRPVSAALGELADWPDDAAPNHVERLAFVKWGLAGCRPDWPSQLLRLRDRIEGASACRVVPAAYADWRRAAAPRPADVAHFAVRHRFAALLLDTWGKGGSGLLDWLAPAEAAELLLPCRAAGVRVAVAGSLAARAIRTLRPHVEPDWFAVRGSVCGGDRTARLDPARVRELVELLRGRAGPADG